jgi:hypothetical protein
MKIALCFSGQPRFIDQSYELILKNVIQNYSVDVFAHLWFDNKLISAPYKFGGNGGWEKQRIEYNAIENFYNKYNPTLIKVEESKSFKNNFLKETYHGSLMRYKRGSINNPLEPNFTERDINNIFSYYYSLNKVCLLKKEYEYTNDFKYDLVIRMRTDSLVHTKLNYSSVEDNVLYYSANQNQPDGMINDWLNYGKSNVMDCFMGCYPIMEYLIEDCKKQTNGAWCCELIHKKMMDKMGINSKGLNIHIELPRF